MRRRFLNLLTVCIIAAQGQQIVDESYPVPGLVLQHYTAPEPWSIYVLKIDLRSPHLSLSAAKANQHLFSLATTSAIAEFNNTPESTVVAAINGDFFHSSGVPTGGMEIHGVVLKQPIKHSVFGFTVDGKPFIDVIEFSSWLENGAARIDINGYNSPRVEDQTIVYNRYYGRSTRTNGWGHEYFLRYIDSPKALNDTLRMVVQTVQVGVGDMAIPEDGIILSSHGAATTALMNTISLLDTVEYISQTKPLAEKVEFFVAGLPRIIRDGKVSVEADEGPNKHIDPRHPRTAVGYDESGNNVYFVVVDGRQPGYSVGMSLDELARFMVNIGVYQGLNLDGGGSSALVVKDVVVNRPSDTTGERAVSNAVLVIREK